MNYYNHQRVFLLGCAYEVSLQFADIAIIYSPIDAFGLIIFILIFQFIDAKMV